MKVEFLKPLSVLFLSTLVCSCSTNEPVKTPTIQEHVNYLASDSLQGRATGSKGEKLATSYIAKWFEQYQLTPKGTDGYLQSFYSKPDANPHEKLPVSADSAGIQVTNVIGMIDNPGDQIIIIGAHHDHLGMGDFGSMHRGDSAIHNGADDNASGVAVLLHLAENLQHKKLNDDVLFITFSGEEKGLWGSNYFTKNPTIDLSKVKSMINMDMVGKLNENRDLVVHGTGTSPIWPDVLNNNNTLQFKVTMKESGIGPSDHSSFYIQDIPVLHFFTGQHEDYHKPGDDPEKLNYEGMNDIALYLTAVVEDINKKDSIAFTKTKDESQNSPRFTVTLGVMPDYLFDGEGMQIADVTEGKPAAIAGLEKGDIVIQLGDSTVNNMQSYMRALSAFKKGDSTQVKVLRGDEEKIYPVLFQ